MAREKYDLSFVDNRYRNRRRTSLVTHGMGSEMVLSSHRFKKESRFSLNGLRQRMEVRRGARNNNQQRGGIDRSLVLRRQSEAFLRANRYEVNMYGLSDTQVIEHALRIVERGSRVHINLMLSAGNDRDFAQAVLRAQIFRGRLSAPMKVTSAVENYRRYGITVASDGARFTGTSGEEAAVLNAGHRDREARRYIDVGRRRYTTGPRPMYVSR